MFDNTDEESHAKKIFQIVLIQAWCRSTTAVETVDNSIYL